MTDKTSFKNPKDVSEPIDETHQFAPRFDANGLITAIARDVENGEILMVAYMNEEALRLTIETGEGWYWSRSRKKLWKKGETSGHTQKVIELFTDCDQDVIEMTIEQKGAACHTNRRSCIYRRITRGEDGEITLTPR